MCQHNNNNYYNNNNNNNVAKKTVYNALKIIERIMCISSCVGNKNTSRLLYSIDRFVIMQVDYTFCNIFTEYALHAPL